nr:hypothetical protein [Tanacetum cinerariifolium]
MIDEKIRTQEVLDLEDTRRGKRGKKEWKVVETNHGYVSELTYFKEKEYAKGIKNLPNEYSFARRGLPADIYSLVNHHRVDKYLWERVQLLMQDSGLAVLVKNFPGDDPISCLNKAMAFLTVVASSRFLYTNNQLRTSSNTRNQATIQDSRVTVQQVQGDKGKIISVLLIRVMLRAQKEILQVDRKGLLNATTVRVNDIWLGNALSLSDKGMMHGQVQTIIPHNATFQTKDLDTYDSECDDLANLQAIFMANISNYGSDVISEVPNSDNYLIDMDNLTVLVNIFPGDDPISCLNKAMVFLTVVASLRFLYTNNQLRTSSNTRNQASIQDSMVTLQQVQGDKGKIIPVLLIRPKRQRNAAWYKEKAMLAEVQEAGQLLDDEQLTFLVDLRIPAGQVQTIIPHNAAFQTKDLDTYDSECDDLVNLQAIFMANISNYGSDVISETIIPNNATFQAEDLDTYDSNCDDISNEKAVLMAKISNYGSDAILEVPHSKTYLNDMENQSVLAMQDFVQPPAVDFTDNVIHSDSNIILYSQYLQETQQENVQDAHLSAQKDSMILSVIKQMSKQMINNVNN